MTTKKVVLVELGLLAIAWALVGLTWLGGLWGDPSPATGWIVTLWPLAAAAIIFPVSVLLTRQPRRPRIRYVWQRWEEQHNEVRREIRNSVLRNFFRATWRGWVLLAGAAFYGLGLVGWFFLRAHSTLPVELLFIAWPALLGLAIGTVRWILAPAYVWQKREAKARAGLTKIRSFSFRNVFRSIWAWLKPHFLAPVGRRIKSVGSWAWHHKLFLLLTTLGIGIEVMLFEQIVVSIGGLSRLLSGLAPVLLWLLALCVVLAVFYSLWSIFDKSKKSSAASAKIGVIVLLLLTVIEVIFRGNAWMFACAFVNALMLYILARLLAPNKERFAPFYAMANPDLMYLETELPIPRLYCLVVGLLSLNRGLFIWGLPGTGVKFSQGFAPIGNDTDHAANTDKMSIVRETWFGFGSGKVPAKLLNQVEGFRVDVPIGLGWLLGVAIWYVVPEGKKTLHALKEIPIPVDCAGCEWEGAKRSVAMTLLLTKIAGRAKLRDTIETVNLVEIEKVRARDKLFQQGVGVRPFVAQPTTRRPFIDRDPSSRPTTGAQAAPPPRYVGEDEADAIIDRFFKPDQPAAQEDLGEDTE